VYGAPWPDITAHTDPRKETAMKTKSITLSDGWVMGSGSPMFQVERITDSIQYYTGQFLGRDEVSHLCDTRHWKVTIVPKKTS